MNSEADRLNGYREALEELGFNYTEYSDWVDFVSDYKDTNVFSDKNIAFVVTCGIFFTWGYEGIKKSLFDVANCKVVCFDKPQGDFPLNISVSWYRQPATLISKTAVELIRDNVKERQILEFQGKIHHIN